MKIHMSRARFESIAAGLSPVERDKLLDQVEIYPEEFLPEWDVDQQRIADAYARLAWDDFVTSRLAARHYYLERWYWAWPRRDGKTGFADGLFDSWTPVPRASTEPGPPRPLDSPWASIADLLTDQCDEPEGARRYFLNDLVTAPPAAPAPLDFTELNRLMDVYVRLHDTAPRRLHAGQIAIETLAATIPDPSPRRGWAKNVAGQIGDLAALSGIPVVLDPGLPPNAWKLVDPVTKEVLLEGTLGPDVDDYTRVIRKSVEDLAADSATPMNLLWPESDTP